MQTTSTLWQEMIENPLVSKREKVVIAGTAYGVEELVGGNITEGIMDSSLEIGNAVAKELQVKLFPKVPIPRMAKIEHSVQLVIADATGAIIQQSEWLPKGVYYVDTRSKTPGGMVTLTAYDTMLKADTVWWDSSQGTGDWPMKMTAAVQDIAQHMGVELDPRTKINPDYVVEYPNDRTMREILCDIASAHGGVWVMSDVDKLRLIRLGQPQDTVVVGNKVGKIEVSDPFEKITRVTLYWGDEQAFTSPKDPKDPSDTGRELVADCTCATQAMADAVLAQLSNYTYIPFTSESAFLNPAYEIGDNIQIGDITSTLAIVHSNISIGVICKVAAPYEQEVDHEFPYVGTISRNLKRKVALGTKYFGTSISREYGLKIEKTDGENVVGEAIFNSDQLTMRALDKDGNMSDAIFFDALKRKYHLTGEVIIDGAIESDANITDALYAEQGDVAQLTVDWLDTSKRIKKYLEKDVSIDFYIEAHDHTLAFVRGDVFNQDGSTENVTHETARTEQMVNRYGNPLYWKSDISNAEIVNGYPYVDGERVYVTQEATDFPVIVYSYKKGIMRQITFESTGEIDSQGKPILIPVDTFGQGFDSEGRTGKGRITKEKRSFEFSYVTTQGVTTGLAMRDDGFVDVHSRRASVEINTGAKKFVISPEGELASPFDILYNDSGNTLELTWPDGEVFRVVKS